MMDSILCSEMSTYQPHEFELPIELPGKGEHIIRSVPIKQTYHTLEGIHRLQNSNRSIVKSSLKFIVLGIVLAYVTTVIMLLTLLNVVVALMILVAGWRYVRWSIKNVLKDRAKELQKGIEQWLNA